LGGWEVRDPAIIDIPFIKSAHGRHSGIFLAKIQLATQTLNSLILAGRKNMNGISRTAKSLSSFSQNQSG
jgi:hypothetical protein